MNKIENVIFDFDKNPQILQFQFENVGVHIWPLYRYRLFRMMRNKITQNTFTNKYSTCKNSQNLIRDKVDKLSYLYKSYINRPEIKKEKYNGIIFSSDAGCIINSGRAESRINDFLNSITGLKILNIYSSHNQKYFVKYKSENYCFFDFIYLKANYKLKFARTILQESTKNHINSFIELLKSSVELNNKLDDSDWLNIYNDLKNFALILPLYKRNLFSLLKKWNPKFIVIEDGNYGGQSYLIKWANEIGIKTIEVQHGVLDIAYQYSDRLLTDPEFVKYKPQYLLTYGKFWKNTVPKYLCPYDIGYPYLEKRADELLKKVVENNNQILFISQGNDTNQLIDVANDLADLISSSNYRIIYRLHPSENHEHGKYLRLKKWKNVSFSKDENIYELIAASKHIVGSYSFVLFETNMFKKIPYIHKNFDSDKYIPENLGVRFSTASELSLLVGSGKYNGTIINDDYFWTRKWRSKLEEFNKLERIW